MKKILASLLATFALLGGAQANTALVLDKFPQERVTDLAALQNGAKLFVNYCLNCHAASYVRYNRLKDIGLTDQQIKDNLLFAAEKVGETMKVALDPKDAKIWFGATPPDLTLVARSRVSASGSGSDYLYTYLRSFNVDETTWSFLMWACPMCCGNCKGNVLPSLLKRKILTMLPRRFTSSTGLSS